jgi:hypothetical protein
MATRSSMLYLERAKIVLAELDDLPRYPPNRLLTHYRPHTLLPELRNLEYPDDRLEAVPLDEVKGQIERSIQTE